MRLLILYKSSSGAAPRAIDKKDYVELMHKKYFFLSQASVTFAFLPYTLLSVPNIHSCLFHSSSIAICDSRESIERGRALVDMKMFLFSYRAL